MNKTMLMNITLMALATALIAAPMTAQKADPAELQLKAAIQKEVEDGDLKAAIALYSKLAESPNRAVAAQALVRMGQCYDKLGDTEARKAYERVVRDFSDQKESLAAAQKHLAEKAAPPESGVTVQRLATLTGSTDVFARQINIAISRNGRYLVFDKDDGVYLQDLIKGTANRIVSKTSPLESFMAGIFPDGRQVVYVRNVVQDATNSTGELHVIGRDGSKSRLLFAGKAGEFLMLLAVSPEGRQVAYASGRREGDSGRGDFYVVDVDDSTPRRLYSGEKDEYPLSTIYSPDGKQLLVWAIREGAGGYSRLLLIPVAEGSSRVIGPGTGYGQFSPDGRYISYYRWPDPSSGIQGGIYMAPTDGGKPVLLVGGAASDPRWTPDGKKILFLNQRPDQSDPRNRNAYVGREPCDLYSIRVRDGQPEGKPELMKKDLVLPSWMLGATQDGNFYFGYTADESANVYVVDLDPATGKAVSKPSRLNQTFIDRSAGAPRWSPDGQWLAYRKVQSVSTNVLMIRSAGTGEERELTVSPPYDSTSLIFPVEWFPDSRSLLTSDQVQGRTVFRKVDIQTGKQQLFLERPADEALSLIADLSPDGKALFFSLSKPDAAQSADPQDRRRNTLRLMRRNMESGEDLELYHGTSNSPRTQFEPMLSSDGRQLAFIRKNSDNTTSLLTMPANGGDARELYRSNLLTNMNPSNWTKDGRHILVVQSDPSTGMNQLWSISAENGERVPAGLTFPVIGGASLHPDGRRFTFIGRQPGQTELWVMKLLPPGPKP